MNKLFERLMGEATHLTTQGQLLAATQAIQQALRGEPTPAPDATDAPFRGLVIEGETRFIDDDEADRGLAIDTDADLHGDFEARHAGDMVPESWTADSFSHQGRTLAYRLYVPPSPAGMIGAMRPLVVMLHGCTQDAADFAAGTRMNALARDAGVLVLYPEQAQRANAQRCWNWFKPQHQQRDRGEPGVLAALTQSVVARHRVDPARVYVAGLSAGGAMADVLGHCYPDLFAAVGVHSGLPHASANDVMSAMARMRQGAGAAAPAKASTQPSPPVIVFHGDADATVHPANGAAVASAARGPVAHASPTIIEGRSARGQRYTRSVSPASDGRGAIEHWVLHGAGHAWAGGSAEGSYTDPTGVDASAEMLRFFLAHRSLGARA